MTDKQFNRFNQLVQKMEAAAAQAGRTHTDTADLTPAERAEYRKLYALSVELAEGERAAATVRWMDGQLAAMVHGEADGRIGIPSDAAW